MTGGVPAQLPHDPLQPRVGLELQRSLVCLERLVVAALTREAHSQHRPRIRIVGISRDGGAHKALGAREIPALDHHLGAREWHRLGSIGKLLGMMQRGLALIGFADRIREFRVFDVSTGGRIG